MTATSDLFDVPGVARLVDDLLPRCTFPPTGTSVTCAVSGGADSSALAVLAVAAGCRPTLVHVDHGLRAGSELEAGVVDRLAQRLGVDARSVRVDVGAGPNLEARARAARYGALPPDVLTGHTADDQAETVLINLFRGAATAGLAGIRPGHRRPLLALRRAETEALCAAARLEIVDDPSNADLTHLRNRVRHDLLPALSAAAGRDLVPILVRQAGLLRDDEDLLQSLADGVDPTDARALAGSPEPLARRAVRRWLTGGASDAHPPDAATVDRVLAVARGEAIACETNDGRRVERSHQRLRLAGGARTGTNGPPVG